LAFVGPGEGGKEREGAGGRREEGGGRRGDTHAPGKYLNDQASGSLSFNPKKVNPV
jgi:hypothetical protein